MTSKLALTLLVAIAAALPTASAEEHPGKELFLEAKCNMCHAVESAGIEAVRDGSKAPDMSNAGADIESAEWAKKFVLRETDKDGKKHQRPWKGPEKDLDQIVAWLLTLKTS